MYVKYNEENFNVLDISKEKQSGFVEAIIPHDFSDLFEDNFQGFNFIPSTEAGTVVPRNISNFSIKVLRQNAKKTNSIISTLTQKFAELKIEMDNLKGVK